MKQYILAVLAITSLLTITSCKEQDLQVFGDEKFIYFDKFWMDAIAPGTQKADSTGVTFFFAGENDTHVYAKLVVVLAGRPLDKDLPFKLRVVEKLTTAQPGEYTLADHYVFRAKPVGPGETQIQDTIQIQINRSERIMSADEGFKLALEIVPDERVKAGQYERSIARIHVTKDPVRPTWWTKEIEGVLLGTYSPKKYKLFLLHVPGANLIDETYLANHPDRVRKMVLEFKKWLQDNPTIDETTGQPMTVMV